MNGSDTIKSSKAGMRKFAILVEAQMISSIGSGLDFGLTIYVLARQGLLLAYFDCEHLCTSAHRFTFSPVGGVSWQIIVTED